MSTDPEAGQIAEWLTADFDLGPGRARALVLILSPRGRASVRTDDRIDGVVSGPTAHCRNFATSQLRNFATSQLRRLSIDAMRQSGRDLTLAVTTSYLSLVSDGRKFAIFQSTTDRQEAGSRAKASHRLTVSRPSGQGTRWSVTALASSTTLPATPGCSNGCDRHAYGT